MQENTPVLKVKLITKIFSTIFGERTKQIQVKILEIGN